MALGMPPPKAAAASKRFAPQLKELAEMGRDLGPARSMTNMRYNGIQEKRREER